MNCFACDEPSPYPVCNACTREGYDVNKLMKGEQKPKFDKSNYRQFLFKETIWYDVFAKDEEHAHRKVQGDMRVKRKLEVSEQFKLKIKGN